MDKETNKLIDFYHDRIKYLEDKNKEKQDKLDMIKSYCEDDNEYMGNDSYINGLNEGNKEIKNGVLRIIKGDDK